MPRSKRDTVATRRPSAPSPESPLLKKRKVLAQRKFAQGVATPFSTGSAPPSPPAPARDASPPPPPSSPFASDGPLPKTEDFITFLCFRGTSRLPPHLEKFNHPTVYPAHVTSKKIKQSPAPVSAMSASHKEQKQVGGSMQNGHVKMSASKPMFQKQSHALRSRPRGSPVPGARSDKANLSSPALKRARVVLRKLSHSSLIAKKKSQSAKLRAQKVVDKKARMLQRLVVSSSLRYPSSGPAIKLAALKHQRPFVRLTRAQISRAARLRSSPSSASAKVSAAAAEPASSDRPARAQTTEASRAAPTPAPAPSPANATVAQIRQRANNMAMVRQLSAKLGRPVTHLNRPGRGRPPRSVRSSAAMAASPTRRSWVSSDPQRGVVPRREDPARSGAGAVPRKEDPARSGSSDTRRGVVPRREEPARSGAGARSSERPCRAGGSTSTSAPPARAQDDGVIRPKVPLTSRSKSRFWFWVEEKVVVNESDDEPSERPPMSPRTLRDGRRVPGPGDTPSSSSEEEDKDRVEVAAQGRTLRDGTVILPKVSDVKHQPDKAPESERGRERPGSTAAQGPRPGKLPKRTSKANEVTEKTGRRMVGYASSSESESDPKKTERRSLPSRRNTEDVRETPARKSANPRNESSSRREDSSSEEVIRETRQSSCRAGATRSKSDLSNSKHDIPDREEKPNSGKQPFSSSKQPVFKIKSDSKLMSKSVNESTSESSSDSGALKPPQNTRSLNRRNLLTSKIETHAPDEGAKLKNAKLKTVKPASNEARTQRQSASSDRKLPPSSDDSKANKANDDLKTKETVETRTISTRPRRGLTMGQRDAPSSSEITEDTDSRRECRGLSSDSVQKRQGRGIDKTVVGNSAGKSNETPSKKANQKASTGSISKRLRRSGLAGQDTTSSSPDEKDDLDEGAAESKRTSLRTGERDRPVTPSTDLTESSSEKRKRDTKRTSVVPESVSLRGKAVPAKNIKKPFSSTLRAKGLGRPALAIPRKVPLAKRDATERSAGSSSSEAEERDRAARSPRRRRRSGAVRDAAARRANSSSSEDVLAPAARALRHSCVVARRRSLEAMAAAAAAAAASSGSEEQPVRVTRSHRPEAPPPPLPAPPSPPALPVPPMAGAVRKRAFVPGRGGWSDSSSDAEVEEAPPVSPARARRRRPPPGPGDGSSSSEAEAAHRSPPKPPPSAEKPRRTLRKRSEAFFSYDIIDTDSDEEPEMEVAIRKDRSAQKVKQETAACDSSAVTTTSDTKPSGDGDETEDKHDVPPEKPEPPDPTQKRPECVPSAALNIQPAVEKQESSEGRSEVETSASPKRAPDVCGPSPAEAVSSSQPETASASEPPAARPTSIAAADRGLKRKPATSPLATNHTPPTKRKTPTKSAAFLSKLKEAAARPKPESGSPQVGGGTSGSAASSLAVYEFDSDENLSSLTLRQPELVQTVSEATSTTEDRPETPPAPPPPPAPRSTCTIATQVNMDDESATDPEQPSPAPRARESQTQTSSCQTQTQTPVKTEVERAEQETPPAAQLPEPAAVSLAVSRTSVAVSPSFTAVSPPAGPAAAQPYPAAPAVAAAVAPAVAAAVAPAAAPTQPYLLPAVSGGPHLLTSRQPPPPLPYRAGSALLPAGRRLYMPLSLQLRPPYPPQEAARPLLVSMTTPRCSVQPPPGLQQPPQPPRLQQVQYQLGAASLFASSLPAASYASTPYPLLPVAPAGKRPLAPATWSSAAPIKPVHAHMASSDSAWWRPAVSAAAGSGSPSRGFYAPQPRPPPPGLIRLSPGARLQAVSSAPVGLPRPPLVSLPSKVSAAARLQAPSVYPSPSGAAELGRQLPAALGGGVGRPRPPETSPLRDETPPRPGPASPVDSKAAVMAQIRQAANVAPPRADAGATSPADVKVSLAPPPAAPVAKAVTQEGAVRPMAGPVPLPVRTNLPVPKQPVGGAVSRPAAVAVPSRLPVSSTLPRPLAGAGTQRSPLQARTRPFPSSSRLLPGSARAAVTSQNVLSRSPGTTGAAAAAPSAAVAPSTVASAPPPAASTHPVLKPRPVKITPVPVQVQMATASLLPRTPSSKLATAAVKPRPPSTVQRTPAPPALKPAPLPTSAKQAPAPTTAKPAPAPTTAKPVPAPSTSKATASLSTPLKPGSGRPAVKSPISASSPSKLPLAKSPVSKPPLTPSSASKPPVAPSPASKSSPASRASRPLPPVATVTEPAPARPRKPSLADQEVVSAALLQAQSQLQAAGVTLTPPPLPPPHNARFPAVPASPAKKASPDAPAVASPLTKSTDRAAAAASPSLTKSNDRAPAEASPGLTKPTDAAPAAGAVASKPGTPVPDRPPSSDTSDVAKTPAATPSPRARRPLQKRQPEDVAASSSSDAESVRRSSAASPASARGGARRRPAADRSEDSGRESTPLSQRSSRSPAPARPRKPTPAGGPPAPSPVPQPSAMESAGLRAAPVFHPSEREFADPLTYIESIRPAAEQHGLCRVVPPPGFKPECRVQDDMRFVAYNHYVHKVFRRWGPNFRELLAIRRHLEQQDIDMEDIPLVGGMEVDLPGLYHTVQQLGGLNDVITGRRWQAVADLINLPKCAQDRAAKLDHIYCKFLLSYTALTEDERKRLRIEVETEWRRRQQEARRSQNRDPDDSEGNSEDDDDASECIVKGKTVSLGAFYRVARNTTAMLFKQSDPRPETVEDEYWKVVNERDRHICVYSGSIDSGVQGYGFVCDKKSQTARLPWNLKVLSNNPGSVLRSMGQVMGVTVPTLHMGMAFTTGCWYSDPHSLPWIEYLHTGASKIWYSVPASAGEELHARLRDLMPGYLRAKPLWLPSDTAMVPPDQLVADGVPVSRTVQQPGEFVVAFPRAFTSSLGTGYTLSESVFFAPPSWVDTAPEVYDKLSASGEPSIFPLDRLVLGVCSDSRASLAALVRCRPLLAQLQQRQHEAAQRLSAAGVTRTEKLNSGSRKKRRSAPQEEDDRECDTCRRTLFSAMVENTEEEVTYCLDDALELSRKPGSEPAHLVLMRMYTQTDFEELLRQVDEKIAELNSKQGSSKKKQKKC